MRNKKSGFTLIELLAVIIILAIVALIATPIILDVIGDARISAGRSEANMILGGINNYCASEDMKYQLDNSYEKICTSSMDKDDVPTMVNLGNATIESIKYNGEKLTELVITSNKHKFTLCPSGTFAMDNEKCEGGNVAITTGPIKDVILSNFPQLELGENGCKNSTEDNYSYSKGCYIKGNPTNNYIWYSGFLWRIMGINADGTVRMITDENVTAIPWGAIDTAEKWDESHAKDWLNNYFYPRLKGNNIIKEEFWCSETTTDSSSARTGCTTNLSTTPSYIGLLTIDEYNLAGGSNSYLNIGQYQWTMTPETENKVFSILYDGQLDGFILSEFDGVRAVINVNSNIIITGGNGTIGSSWNNELGPYILNEDKNVEIVGKLNEKATSGEYVMFAGKKYRVVDKDDSGNTKLILEGYAYGVSIEYGDDNTFSTTTGVGKKLNTDVLEWLVASNDTTNRNKLVSNYTWYQNKFEEGYSYRVSLEESNPTRSVSATVGLIRVGEMLSNQSSSMLTDGYTKPSSSSYNNVSTYWTITPYISGNSAWGICFNGKKPFSITTSNMYSLRPVLVINSDVTITSGNGTWSNPYQI